MAIYIGTSGWSYDHWQGVLYPHGASGPERFAGCVARYNTVEVNSPFYRWPSQAVFRAWHNRLPQGFRMTVKASRALSHSKRLYEPEVWTARMAQSLKSLGDKLGVWLVQLPPSFERDDARLRYFLQQIPASLQTAIEFRHPSWHCDEVFGLLEEHGVALCVMSGAGLLCVLRATAPFVYVRFHGPDHSHLYAGSYSDDDLRWWAARIHEWHHGGKEVWAYFNNDGDGNAVRNADTLRHFVGA
jgi:uncharacterized protein YecE (DUF72 family)